MKHSVCVAQGSSYVFCLDEIRTWNEKSRREKKWIQIALKWQQRKWKTENEESIASLPSFSKQERPLIDRPRVLSHRHIICSYLVTRNSVTWLKTTIRSVKLTISLHLCFETHKNALQMTTMRKGFAHINQPTAFDRFCFILLLTLFHCIHCGIIAIHRLREIVAVKWILVRRWSCECRWSLRRHNDKQQRKFHCIVRWYLLCNSFFWLWSRALILMCDNDDDKRHFDGA